MSDKASGLLLKDYHPRPLLRRPEHIPEKARFPVIDAHNHLFGDLPADAMLKVMDDVGVQTFVNVTGNVTLPFDDQGYTINRRDFSIFANSYLKPHPGRFAALTMSDFAQWGDEVLIKDDGFARRAIQHLEEDMALGARGLKITKELGLRFRDYSGAMLAIDDERLAPIWKRLAELHAPVLIHVSDPVAFFIPLDETNEHYPTLQEFPGWGFQNSYFSKWALLEQRDRVIARNHARVFLASRGKQPEA